jgi:hypothetical protein
MADYERQVTKGGKPILAGSIYQEAERRGWVWPTSPGTPGVGAGASAGVVINLKGGTHQANDATLRMLSERYRFVKEEGRIVPYRYDEEKGWLPSDRDSMKLELANVLIGPISDKTIRSATASGLSDLRRAAR